jgi:hypothetical protein
MASNPEPDAPFAGATGEGGPASPAESLAQLIDLLVKYLNSLPAPQLSEVKLLSNSEIDDYNGIEPRTYKTYGIKLKGRIEGAIAAISKEVYGGFTGMAVFLTIEGLFIQYWQDVSNEYGSPIGRARWFIRLEDLLHVYMEEVARRQLKKLIEVLNSLVNSLGNIREEIDLIDSLENIRKKAMKNEEVRE